MLGKCCRICLRDFSARGKRSLGAVAVGARSTGLFVFGSSSSGGGGGCWGNDRERSFLFGNGTPHAIHLHEETPFEKNALTGPCRLL